MYNEKQFVELFQKIERLKHEGKVDLSTDEDLSIAVMNLVSLEEHFFFTGAKTGKPEYFDLLTEVRAARTRILARLMPENEGESWCIAKHLLAATMRLIEVGTKLQAANKKGEAQEMFGSAYKLYALFWALRFKLVNANTLKHLAGHESEKPSGKPWSYEDLVTKLVDCCDEHGNKH